MYFCWGARRGGQRRRELPLARGAELRQAASGERHSLLLLSDGTVHSCGDNSRGQLGRRGALRGERPGEHLHREQRARGQGEGALGALGTLGARGPQETASGAPRCVYAAPLVSFSRRALSLFRFPIPLQRKLKGKL